MKRLLLLTTLLFCTVTFGVSSCKKEETKYCWECVTKRVNQQYPALNTITTSTKTTICDKTGDDIKTYEKENTSQTTGNSYVLTTTTTCSIK